MSGPAPPRIEPLPVPVLARMVAATPYPTLAARMATLASSPQTAPGTSSASSGTRITVVSGRTPVDAPSGPTTYFLVQRQ